jgi:hypothetical protein
MVKTIALLAVLLAATPAIADQFNNNGAGSRYSPFEPSHWQAPSERDDVPRDDQRDSHSDNGNKEKGYQAPQALPDADAEPFWCEDQNRTGC